MSLVFYLDWVVKISFGIGKNCSFIVLYLNCRIFSNFFEIYSFLWHLLQIRDDDIVLPYWLSNTSALLCLLQRNLRSNGFLITAAQRYSGSSGLTSRIGHVSYLAEYWYQTILFFHLHIVNIILLLCGVWLTWSKHLILVLAKLRGVTS